MVTPVRRHPFLALAGAVVGAVVLSSVAARANVRSQALYARGLVPFNTGQWDQAYRLFNEAVQADSTDAVALYYRGLTEARRGATAAAIQDIEKAIELNPSLPHAALDLGIAYFDSGQYAVAKTWLERGLQQGSERFTAAFFLGLTLYRLGDDAAALPYLNQAKADPELRAAAGYYAGLALLRQGNTEAGRTELTEVTHQQPQSEVGKAAQRYTAMEEGRRPSKAPEEAAKPWSLAATASVQYDSNVVIEPSDSDVLLTAQGVSGQDDGAAVLTAGGGYTLLDAVVGSLRAEYDFYQSIHFQLTEFDLQGHRVRLGAASRPGNVSYGITGTYDFYALDYQSFFQEALATPWVSVAEGEAAAMQVYYTMRGRDFFRDPFDPGRDSINNAAGIRQYAMLGSAARVLGVGYQFDSEDTLSDGPMGKDFEYNGHQLDIGVSLPLWSLVDLQLAYLFRLEDYQFPNSRADFEFRRHDNAHQFVVALAHDLAPHVAVISDFIGIINNSNVGAFDYDRYIVSLGLRMAF
jgi:tetratricopeptide (TPR) repeat protein